MSGAAAVIRVSMPLAELLVIVGGALVAGVVVGVVLSAVLRR